MNSQGSWRLAAVALAAWLLSPAGFAGPVNVNTADAATLARELQGIGAAKAQAIVAHRDKHGPFRSIDDLARVKGIGRKTLDRNRDFIRLDGRTTATAGATRGAPGSPLPGSQAAPRRSPTPAPADGRSR